MAFDQTRIGQLTASLMEQLDEQFGEDCEFGDLMIIVEVLGPHGSTVTLQMSNPRRHPNLGLLVASQDILRGSAEG